MTDKLSSQMRDNIIEAHRFMDGQEFEDFLHALVAESEVCIECNGKGWYWTPTGVLAPNGGREMVKEPCSCSLPPQKSE